MKLLRFIRRVPIPAALVAAATTFACSDSISDHIIGLDAEGTVFVFLYRDNDLNSNYNANVDTRLTGARVDLQMRGSLQITPGGVTDTSALRVFHVPVGRYNVRVAASVLGDSLEVVAAPEFTISANDSTSQLIALKYKTYSVGELRALPTTRRGWVRGVVVNSPNTFGDSTVHLHADTGSLAIRVTGVRPGFPVIAGDTALFFGQRSIRDGQSVLLTTPATPPVILAVGPTPAPDTLTSATAASAQGGLRDARFAKILRATVSDTITFNGDKVMTVNDGSGPLKVVLSQNINFGNLNQYRPGIILDVAGVLLPDVADPGRWLLKPRARADVVILP